MATQAEIDELFRQTLEGDYDDEEDEGGPWEAVSKLQAIASREVFDKAVQWSRNKQPAKRRRGVDILAQLGKTEDYPDVVFAAESYSIIANVLEDELDLQVIDSCLVAFGHLGNPAAVPLILEHRANSDPDVRFAVAFGLSCFADEPDAIRALLGLQHLFLTWDRFAHHLHRCIHFPHSDLWTCRKLRPTSRIDGLSIALAHDWRFVLHAKYRSRPKNEGAARFEVDNLCSRRPQIMIHLFWCCLPAAARYPGSCWRIVLALCWDCRSHKQHSKSKRTA